MMAIGRCKEVQVKLMMIGLEYTLKIQKKLNITSFTTIKCNSSTPAA